MNFDDGALYGVLAAYGTRYSDVLAGETPADDWKRRFGADYADVLAELPLTDTGDLETLLDPFLASQPSLDEPVAASFAATSSRRWRSFRQASLDSPAGAAPVLSTLLDDDEPLDNRLNAFMDFYGSRIEEAGARIDRGTRSVSAAQLLGVGTTLLTFAAPRQYVAYKFSRFRSFCDAFTDYDVATASSVDVVEQYVDLNDGAREVRDRLAEHVEEPTMLDVWNVVVNHEALAELATAEGSGDRPGEGTPTAEKPRRAEELAAQLEAAGQVILYGPPGTGKTWTATRFATWWTSLDDQREPGSVETVTFHPSYTYEDFVEGLTAEAGEDGVRYELRDGQFKRFLAAADEAYESTPADETPPRYVLVVDEINRGNLPAILGELVTAIERDKRKDRAGSVEVELAHSGEPMAIPPNLYLLGTMNTADRSIALVDAALRRRFRFLPFPPDYDVLLGHHGFDDWDAVDDAAGATEPTSEALVARSIRALRAINENLRTDLERGKQLGHSYLLDVADVDDVVAAWRYELLPQLEEYYYGRFDQLRSVAFDGGGDRLFTEDGRIAAFDAGALYDELGRLGR